MERLHPNHDAAREPTAAERNDESVDIGNRIQKLLGQGPLSANQFEIIEGRHEGESPIRGIRFCECGRFFEGISELHYRMTVMRKLLFFNGTRRRRDAYRCRYAQSARRFGNCQSVISRRCGDDTGTTLLKTGQFPIGSSKFERSRDLITFKFRIRVYPVHGFEPFQLSDVRPNDRIRNLFRGLFDG